MRDLETIEQVLSKQEEPSIIKLYVPEKKLVCHTCGQHCDSRQEMDHRWLEIKTDQSRERGGEREGEREREEGRERLGMS